MIHCVLDIETTGLSRFKNNISIFGFYVPEYDYVVQIYNDSIQYKVDPKYTAKNTKNLDTFTEEYQDTYNRIIEELNKLPRKADGSFDVIFITQNGKFDTLFIYEKTGIMLPIDEDVMLEQYVLHMGRRKGLDAIVEQEFGEPTWDIPLRDKFVATPKSLDYHKKDIVNTWRCHESLRPKVYANPTYERLYKKLVMPSFLVYRQVENNGIFFNEAKYEQVYSEYTQKLDSLEAQLKTYADINWGSAKQVGDYLYKTCMFPVFYKTDTGAPSTGERALKRLAGSGIEIANILLEYKFYKQAVNTFLKPWRDFIHNGRIYPTFNIDTVRTGRTSSNNPNLQQVPRDINLRSLFTAPADSMFYEIDHSQLELRVASHVMNETNMIEAYNKGEDLHTKTAREIVGHEPSKQERTMAKPVNFGFLYGMQSDSLPDYAYSNYGLEFTKEQSKTFRDAFFRAYPNLQRYYKLQEATCKDPTVGGASTIFGRFRYLPELFSNDWGTRQYGVRCCINTPTQSAGSDILISGMIEIQHTFNNEGVKIVGTVHDSILLEIKNDEHLQERYEKVKYILEHPSLLKEFGIELKVPLKIDGESCGNVTTGTGWGAGH